MTSSVVNRPFAGKSAKIREQYERFWNQPTAQPDVNAYLHKTSGYVYPDIPKWLKTSTPFTEWSGPVLSESKNALIIANHSSFSTAQYKGNEGRTGMSMIHILGIPKDGIFNGVALNRSNVYIIDEMIKLFKDSWTHKPMFRQQVIDAQEAAINRQKKESRDSEAYKTAMRQFHELKGKAWCLKTDDFTFGFHLWPDHSVSHLHMHIIAMPRELRQYSTGIHDDKTVDALDVREYIQNRS
ncbi:hypothetical protein GGS26DRAFT_590839 [Hypomontagnella submonticulosa]|nr:hypothetical protein GGS26DRAFT_590839 [Hypomontagnella submonticulosa]